jgi:Response regulator containing a CheY-like receiver domain and an HTH DNA-binding domain
MHLKNKTMTDIFLCDNVVNINGLRRQNKSYIFIWILYYAWVIAFATWWTASPLIENLFSTQLHGLLLSVNLISSAVFVFMIRKEWFVKTSRIGAVLIIAGISLFFAVPDTHIQILSVIISSIAIGCVSISILIPFVFTLNNTEKLYAVVGSNVLIQLISLFQEHNTGSKLYGSMEFILSFTILAASLGTTLFFKKIDIADHADDQKLSIPKFHRRIYLTIFFNCAIVILCKGAGKGMLNAAIVGYGMPVFTWYYIGGLIGCILFIVIYAFSKKAFLWLGNITFSSVAMGILCNAFAEEEQRLTLAFAILLGIGNTVGMINMCYIIGVVGKKYNSLRYLRLSILFIGGCGGISGIMIGDIISNTDTFEISIIASIVSVAVMTLFMIASPIIAQTQYENDWAKDSQHTDIDNEQLYIFSKYELSKREIEVCKLLLQGYTMRQISGILSIAYSTVNTYCTSVYRKLEINSRAELLLMFKDYVVK